MKRVYEYFSTYKTEDTLKRHGRVTQLDIDFIDSLELIDLHYDGEKYTWKDEATNIYSTTIIVCTEDELNRIKQIDFNLHHDAEGYSKVSEVTEEVLMGIYNYDKFGFARENVMIMLHGWRKIYLEEDDVLDKISRYGADSLTQQEKDFLETGVLNNPFLYEIIEDDLED
jgi:hypothetical protein